jgi:hypothetical protein
VKTRTFRRWLLPALLVCGGSVLVPQTYGALTTNSWTSSASGKWEAPGNWSAVAPTNSNAANSITNATTKTVTIDATTTNAANASTLTISNLTVSGPSGTTNTLFLNDAGTNTPLRIRNGFTINSRGALLVTNSALRVESTLGGDFTINGGGVSLLAGASVVATNAAISASIGPSGGGGSLTINGGSMSLSGFIVYTGEVWMADGLLVVTNTFYIGEMGRGQMTVSNGTVLGSSGVIVGRNSGGRGTLTIAGGTVEAPSLQVGKLPASALGSAWMIGGQLVLTNIDASTILLGETGAGEMTVSNGTVLCRTGLVGSQASGRGTLTIAGGTNTLIARLVVGNLANSTGAVWVTGGRLVVEDGGTLASAIGSSGVGQMTVSNGTWLAMTNVTVASGPGSQGSLTIAGGTSSVLSILSIGNFACTATGVVNIVGGELNVTNAVAGAALQLLSGTLTLSAGTLRVDKFVMTNSCGFFTQTGGVLIYGTAVLDPARDDDADGISNGYEQSHGLDPLSAADANIDSDGDGQTNLQEFQAGTDATNSASFFGITSIIKTNNDLSVIWTTGIGKTNALERSTGTINGSYSNNFTAIFTATNIVGATTNYLDVGAATNVPALFYRVRLVP